MGKVVLGILYGKKRTVMAWVKRMIKGGIAAVLVLALVIPLTHANAQNNREIREGVRRGGAQDQLQPRYPREERRPYFQRNEGGEAQRPQRLSTEERRQLRRDIKDAGREIYPSRR